MLTKGYKPGAHYSPVFIPLLRTPAKDRGGCTQTVSGTRRPVLLTPGVGEPQPEGPEAGGACFASALSMLPTFLKDCLKKKKKPHTL